MTWKSLRWFAGVTVSLLVVVAAVAAWAGSVAMTLARLDVRLADDCARVEAASQVRVELVRNLIESSRLLDCMEESRLRSIEQAVDAAEENTLSPEVVHARDPFRGFSITQQTLSRSLDDYWGAASRSADEGAAVILHDLEPRLDEATIRLDEAMQRLSESIRTYEVRAKRFPASIIADFLRPTLPGANRPEPPAITEVGKRNGPES